MSSTTSPKRGQPGYVSPLTGRKRPPGWVNPKKGRPAPHASRPLEERFWEKVNKEGPNGCWVWTGAMLPAGYGSIWFGDRADRSHRVVYFIMFGMRLREDQEVDHVCRNRACCNPGHLRIVDAKTNSLENNLSPFAKNARKTHCSCCGNPLAGANLAFGAGGSEGEVGSWSAVPYSAIRAIGVMQ